MDCSRPGKPTDDSFIDSLNGSFRDECLNMHWFLSLDDVRQKIENWRADYNHFRTQSSMGDFPPADFPHFEGWQGIVTNTARSSLTD